MDKAAVPPQTDRMDSLASRNSTAGACDPVTLEIVRGAIRAAQAEMEALIERTAISAFIREKKDFYTALFDADGVMGSAPTCRCSATSAGRCSATSRPTP